MPSVEPIHVDLNCDLGEGFGPYRLGNDEELLDQVTSANIACGFHAGDAATMDRTVQLCHERNIAIGAHPGLPDRLFFGRRRWDLSGHEAYQFVIYQLGALAGFARARGTRVSHVKPHGALYNMAAQEAELANAIAQAVFDFDPALALYGLAGSELVKAGTRLGLRVAREAFADRTYENDGTLAPRDQSHSVIESIPQAVHQALHIVQNQRVRSRDGVEVAISADTICIHGDRPDAVELGRSLRASFARAGISVRPF